MADDLFEQLFGGKTAIDDFERRIKTKDAEIERLRNLILRCPKCGTKLRYPRG